MVYTIEAKPTKYNGRLYRSRLEARVAAYFDLRGWKFEYEPFDLKAWSPDFLIIGEKQKYLCEVKPESSMFSFKKYAHVDFNEYGLIFIYPTSIIILANHVIESWDQSNDEHWIEAGNKVMFLKPKV